MSEWKARRFWKEATVEDVGGGFGVLLDDRPVRTPMKAALVVPTRAYADAIAAEWAAQDEHINPETMPATRSANAAIDRVTFAMDEVVEMLAAYGDSDLLCYRAEHPEELVARQNAAWDPILDWASDTFRARLEPRTGVMHAPQDADALDALRLEVARFTPFELAAFHDLVTLTGSLVLALATTRSTHPSEEIWALSRVDEDFQIEQWGEDDEAGDVAELKKNSFLRAAALFHALQS